MELEGRWTTTDFLERNNWLAWAMEQGGSILLNSIYFIESCIQLPDVGADKALHRWWYKNRQVSFKYEYVGEISLTYASVTKVWTLS